MTAGEHRHECVIDDFFLTEDDVADRSARSLDAFRRGFGGAHDHLVEVFRICRAQRLLHSRTRGKTQPGLSSRTADSLDASMFMQFPCTRKTATGALSRRSQKAFQGFRLG
jgi:hypothetical protein